MLLAHNILYFQLNFSRKYAFSSPAHQHCSSQVGNDFNILKQRARGKPICLSVYEVTLKTSRSDAFIGSKYYLLNTNRNIFSGVI